MSGALINNNQSPATIRVLGGVLIFIGLLLIGGMGALIVWINDILANNGRSGSAPSFKGSPEEANIIFLVLGAVAAFGLVAMIAGAWQLFTGTRNKILLWIMLGVWAVLMLLAWWVKYFL